MLTNGYLILPQSLILVWLIVILLYRRFYNRNINRILEGSKGHRLIPPWKFFLITAIAVMLTYNVISMVRLAEARREKLYDANGFFNISYSADTMEELDEIAYQGLYSHEENKAYTKTEYTQNDFHYTVFNSQLFSDGMHPDSIVYIEYTGKDLNPYTAITSCRFLDPEGKPISAYMKGDNPKPCFMFMLRYEEDCTVEIDISYVADEENANIIHDADIKERNEVAKEHSLIHETFTLDLKQHG